MGNKQNTCPPSYEEFGKTKPRSKHWNAPNPPCPFRPVVCHKCKSGMGTLLAIQDGKYAHADCK